ncbi:MAG: rhodanese-like domain-containing protein [Chloroflexota bacterium]|nr:rhodanese-like domain-containing protein [Chloroflexota bacterium]
MTTNVILSPDLQQRVFAQMEAAFPNEGGGFLLGHSAASTVEIVDVIGVLNTFAAEEQFHRYEMTPLDWARMEDEADARGLTLVGYFHSHPNSPAIPSIYDRDHALPNFVYIITSVMNAKAVDMRAWQLRVDRGAFDAANLVLAASETHNTRGAGKMVEALVSTQWVADNHTSVRLVEVDVDTTQYATGHAPSAVAFNWQSQLQDQVARDIISKDDFGKLLGEAGIAPDTHVVLYGDNNNWFAAYAFWLFKYYGHEAVSLMDGGRKKWLAESRETTTDVPSYPAATYTVAHVNADLRADRDYIRARLESDPFALVDVRSPAEYVGDIIAPPGMSETAQRPGHIPGAKNIPWAQAVTEDGSFKSKAELTALYGGKGVTADKPDVVAYCRIGERSSHTWFALKYILGFENVRNYDGSWTEWGNLIGAPIRKGDQP